MLKKTSAMLVLAAVLSVFFTAGLLVAADPPTDVQIYYEDVIGKMKKGPVAFSHAKHSTDYGVACDQCHHHYEGGKNVWKQGDEVKKCKDCHLAENSETADGVKVMKLQNAFHKNCKDCHKDNDKGPYKKCEECHAK